MTLREKLKSYAMDNHIEEYAELNTKILEKIADEYAMDFVLWIRASGNISILHKQSLPMTILLEEFKKEKGL